jgi:hypothetical protein
LGVLQTVQIGARGGNTLSQESLWLWCGNNSRIQEEERPPLEAFTRILAKEDREDSVGV